MTLSNDEDIPAATSACKELNPFAEDPTFFAVSLNRPVLRYRIASHFLHIENDAMPSVIRVIKPNSVSVAQFANLGET